MNWEMLLAIAGGIVVLGNATERIIWAWDKAHAPEVTQDERISNLEHRVKTLEGQREDFSSQLAEMRESHRISQEAILALLGHDIDGNNTKQMADARDKLTHYLINH